MVLLPVAYAAFFLLMNNEKVLGEAMPRGGRRWLWNTLMTLAFLLSALGCVYSVWASAAWIGLGLLGAFIALVLIVQFVRPKPA